MELKKSANRYFSGVAAGLAEYQKMNVGFVRMLWLISVPLTGGVSLGVYVLLVFLMKPPSNFDINEFRRQ